MKVYFDALTSILNTNISLFGFSFSLLDVVLVLAFGSLAAWFVGGLLK